MNKYWYQRRKYLVSWTVPFLHTWGYLEAKPMVLKLWFMTSRIIITGELVQNTDSQV